METKINKLVEICKDYKNIDFNFQHVKNWINQFQIEDQKFILENLIYILEKTYISEEKIDSFIQEIIKYLEINVANYKIIEWGVLEINTHGKSQVELNNKLLKAMEKKGIFASICNKDDLDKKIYENYLYLDDIIYTGNTFINDFKNINTKVYCFFYGIYLQSIEYIKNNMPSLEKLKIVCLHKYNNDLTKIKSENGDYAILHSKKEYLNNDLIPYGRKYPITNDMLFKNENDRIKFENIMYEQGRKILLEIKNPAYYIRPLGYCKISKIGFGNMIIFYRNISNNSPIALWFGNIKKYENKEENILGKFYPLFPRTTN